MTDSLSALRATSSVSNFPGVNSTGFPPVVETEYRWFHPSCSEEKIMWFRAAKWNDASAVRYGTESSSSDPLFQISRPESLATSYTQMDQGKGSRGINGCFISLPTTRMKASWLP